MNSRRTFSPYEISLLLELVRKYNSTLESKNNDSASIKKKADKWATLAVEFNSDKQITIWTIKIRKILIETETMHWIAKCNEIGIELVTLENK